MRVIETNLDLYLKAGGILEDLDVSGCYFTGFMVNYYTYLRDRKILSVELNGQKNSSGQVLYKATLEDDMIMDSFHPGNLKWKVDERDLETGPLQINITTASVERTEVLEWFNNLSTNDLLLIKQNWQDDV